MGGVCVCDACMHVGGTVASSVEIRGGGGRGSSWLAAQSTVKFCQV